MYMTGSGCLPVCIHNNKLLFLFGLESPAEISSKGWSDFAGGMEKNENESSDKQIYEAALREMAEETSGFLGDPKEIDILVKKNGGYIKYCHDNNGSNYHMHIFRLDYDEKLIKYYNANHKYLYEKLDHKLLQKTKVFEKIELQWFSLDMMRKKRKLFRSFYRDIIDKLIIESNTIHLFVKKSRKNNSRKTVKQYIFEDD
jgi:8-oxo-dGTP pyrophosphatase MutT (NUDIX family)